MNEKELLEEENKIPGNENESDAETGTAEGGEVVDEAPVEAKESEDMPEIEESIEPEPEQEAQAVQEAPKQEKMLPQSQVNELVGRARAEGRESAMKELYGRYGVNSDDEMNDIFGRGQGYELLNDEYTALNGKYGNLAAENALLKSKVAPGRWDDVKAILGMKGMEVSVENIQAELPTHPEWANNAEVPETQAKMLSPEMADKMAEAAKPSPMEPPKTSQIRKLGANVPEPKVNEEESDAMKWFNLK